LHLSVSRKAYRNPSFRKH